MFCHANVRSTCRFPKTNQIGMQQLHFYTPVYSFRMAAKLFPLSYLCLRRVRAIRKPASNQQDWRLSRSSLKPTGG